MGNKRKSNPKCKNDFFGKKCTHSPYFMGKKKLPYLDNIEFLQVIRINQDYKTFYFVK